MLERQTSVRAVPKSTERRLDIRYVGPVNGCYTLSDRREAAGGELAVYACRTQSMSATEVAITAPVAGEVGEAVMAHLDGFGIIRGQVQRRTKDGFVFDIAAETATRSKLAAKIEWLKLKSVRQQNNNRAHKRFQPRDPRSTVAFADGTITKCFVIDLSRGGAAISAQLRPGVGTSLVLGTLPGRVVRHLDVGFAVQFETVQESDGLEKLATGYALVADLKREPESGLTQGHVGGG